MHALCLSLVYSRSSSAKEISKDLLLVAMQQNVTKHNSSSSAAAAGDGAVLHEICLWAKDVIYVMSVHSSIFGLLPWLVLALMILSVEDSQSVVVASKVVVANCSCCCSYFVNVATAIVSHSVQFSFMLPMLLLPN